MVQLCLFFLAVSSVFAATATKSKMTSQTLIPTPVAPAKPSATATPIGYASLNGGTTGGAGGSTVTVTTGAALQAALLGDTPKIVMVTGNFVALGNITVGSNKSLIGTGSGATFLNTSLSIRYGVRNIIVRNIQMGKCQGGDNDCVTIKDPSTSNIWIDHCDFSGDLSADKDTYDGLVDITRTANYVTLSWNKFHDHHKAVLIGSGDSQVVDSAIRVSIHHNYFHNLGSRTPSVRFATAHIWNNYYESVDTGINTRDSAEVLIQNNQFKNSPTPVENRDGFCVLSGNDFGGGAYDCATGNFTTPPYTYSLDAVTNDLALSYWYAGIGAL
ncbi:hypothetical protein HDU84_007184 [Entophlyctis sp. JEL0112]|nr:hypothetical protein HDU84_007184 [Entophlyctis sp. JEL0112]